MKIESTGRILKRPTVPIHKHFEIVLQLNQKRHSKHYVYKTMLVYTFFFFHNASPRRV